MPAKGSSRSMNRVPDQGSSDFQPAPFSTRKGGRFLFGQMADVQLERSVSRRFFHLLRSEPQLSRMARRFSSTVSFRNTEGSWARYVIPFLALM